MAGRGVVAAAGGVLTLDGLADLCGQLGAAAPKDWTPLLKVVAVLVKADVKTCFDQGRSFDGVPWLPLKRPSKRRGGKTAKPLRDKGLLMASVSASGKGHVEQYGTASLTYGTALDYAGFHQWGTRRIPARPFLGISDQLAGKIATAAADYVVDKLKG